MFGAYAWLNRDQAAANGADRVIRITEREVSWLAETWQRQWQRPPSDSELQGLVADYLREELLGHEARELELDRDDVVIRRRLAQKMEFFLEDTARFAEPTEADLRALYDRDRTRFNEPARVSFVQLFFSTDKRGKEAAIVARQALAQLSKADASRDPGAIGDSTLLPRELVDADEAQIASQFGAEFAHAVMAFAPDSWQGPIESGFGLHIVRVTARRAAESRPFEAVRQQLVEEWRRRSEAAARNAYFNRLLAKYEIQATDSVRPLIDPALATLRSDAK